MKKLLLIALFCASTALAGPRFNSGYQYGNDSEYVYGPEGVYTVTREGTFTGGYEYGLPRVIVTDPCGRQRHGTNYGFGWIFSD